MRNTPQPDSENAKLEANASPGRKRIVRRYKWIERGMLLVAFLAFTGKALVPAWRHLNTDFPNYYLVARLYQSGYPVERAYDWVWLQRQKDHLGIPQNRVNFIPLTLQSALAVLPWTTLPPLQAKHGWLIANVVLLLLTLFLLNRMTTLGWKRVSLLALLAYFPLWDNFLLGQMHVLVLFLVVASALLYFRKSDFSSGILLAIAAALKIYPALFLVYFVLKRRWRAAFGLAAGLAVVAIGSVLVFGSHACVLYVREVLPPALRGETIDPYNTGWNSWTALLRRLFVAEPELNPNPVAHLPVLFAVLQPLMNGVIGLAFLWAIAAKKVNEGYEKLDWAAYLFLLLFISSQPAPYHFVAFIPVVVLFVDALVEKQRINLAVMTAISYVLTCSPIIHWSRFAPVGWQNVFFFQRLALMTVLAGILFWILIALRSERGTSKSSILWALCGAAVIALAVIGSVVSQVRNRSEFDNYQHRITTMPDSLLASEPAVAGGDVFFTHMVADGYTVAQLHAGSVLDLPRAAKSDLFHPAASRSGQVWAEQASQGGSRIVRLALDKLTSSFEVEVEHGQEPAISSDGGFLLFLRDVKGRSSLWVKELDLASEPRELAGPGFDVREAHWSPDHSIVFSSERNGRFQLYRAGLRGEPKPLSNPACSARYPAVSPDGTWMVFSCDQAGTWQLHAIQLGGTQELQLTNSRCNSIAPVWKADSKSIIYATDCGRGLGLTALAEIIVPGRD